MNVRSSPRQVNHPRCGGFTLSEMLIALAIAGILLVVGLPSFRGFMENSAMTSSANALLGDLIYARTEAIKRGVPVTVCKSADGATCDVSSSAFERWIVFVDDISAAVESPNDGNGTVNGAELVLRENTLAEPINSVINGLRIVYLPSGFPDTEIADSFDQVILCGRRGNEIVEGGQSAARAVFVSATGRALVIRDKDEIETAGGC
jgi:prepilin-type N-terminal cleavage/methylation domain-containing protein